MKATLLPGLTHRLAYHAPENKTVPFLYARATDVQDIPKVFATRFMVELMSEDRFDAPVTAKAKAAEKKSRGADG